VNIRFVVEGEEEIGGEHISGFVQSGDPRLKADAAVICDTEMFAPELPTICVGLRGIVYGELIVDGAATDLHSGMYGGAAPNPIQAIAEILCALKGRDGHIRIPGFYDRVRPPSATEREAWARLPFDEERFRTEELKASAITGEPEVDVLERMWARPTLEVHGIRGGFTGEGAKTVIPARALAKISMRLVPDQDPDEASRQFAEAVTTACPRGTCAEWKPFHSAPPSLSDTDNVYVRKCAEAMTEVFGNQTVYIRSGGSIPIAGLFSEQLGIPSVLAGFGLPDDNLHAPNEKLFLPNFYRGIDAIALYLEKLGS
jgi:acetylornithine deacetylase/succinyl-diaminopimelate desuccinylase-like protein